MANKILKEGLSVRELENLVGNNYKRNVEIKRKTKEKVEYKYLEDALEDKLGTKVKILDGKIVINYSSTADLNRIIEIFDIDLED